MFIVSTFEHFEYKKDLEVGKVYYFFFLFASIYLVIVPIISLSIYTSYSGSMIWMVLSLLPIREVT